jgi:hypothetical protein
MPAVLLALALLAVLGLGIFWFLRANPSSLARALRPIMIVLGGIGVGGLLILGVRFLPGLLPELFGLAGVVATGLIARWLRQRPSGGFSSPPGASQRTQVQTAFLEAWIDHATGDVGGRVLSGRFAGRALDAMSDGDLLELHVECSSDGDSLRVLESYLDRRLGADWRQRQAPPRGPRTDMTRAEALAILGLAEGAKEDDIKSAHRRLITRMHPDAGGSAELAARINRAKDVLLGV